MWKRRRAVQPRVIVGQMSHPGVARQLNEDSLGIYQPTDPSTMASKGWLYLIADGMGGHPAGKTASQLAVERVAQEYYADPSPDIAEGLTRAIQRANAEIHACGGPSGMGTTLVGLVVRGREAIIANVGDSRAYLIRGQSIRQITEDHSWVAEQLRAGVLTQAQARTHDYRGTLTRAVGPEPDVKVDIFRERVQGGDTFVLCTDGLTNEVRDGEIGAVVTGYGPQEAATRLVRMANQRGGSDNVTVLVLRAARVPGFVLEALLDLVRVPELAVIAAAGIILALIVAAVFGLAIWRARAAPKAGSVVAPTSPSAPPLMVTPTVEPTTSPMAAAALPTASPTATVKPTATLRPSPTPAPHQTPTPQTFGRVVGCDDRGQFWIFPQPDPYLQPLGKGPCGAEVRIIETDILGRMWSAPGLGRSDRYYYVEWDGIKGYVWSLAIELES